MRLPGFLRYDTWLGRMLDRPWLTIALVVALTALLGAGALRLRLQTSLYDLMIEDLPETAFYEATKETFGTEEIILVVARADDVFDPATFAHLDELASRLGELDGVRRTISLPGAKRAMDITGTMDPGRFREVVRHVDLFRNNLVSGDGTAAGVTLVLEDRQEREELIDRVAAVMEEYENGVSLYQVGMPVVSLALARFTEKDFFTLPPLTFVVIAILLLLLFRTWHGVLLPLSCILVSLIWTVGVMGWTGTPLSMLTMIVPVFLIAVGTAYCLHFSSEYIQLAGKAGTTRETAREVVSRMRFPTALAVGTTMVGLASLLVNRIDSIRQFAIFSCVGMASLLVVLLTLLPAMIVLMSPARARNGERREDVVDRFLAWVIHVNVHHQKAVFVVAGVVLALGIAGIFRIQVETNPCDYFKEDTPVARNFHDVYKDLSGSFPVNVVVNSGTPDFFEDPENLARLAELEKLLVTVDKVDKSVSVTDYMRLVNYATNRFEPERYALPEKGYQVRMIVNSLKTMLGQDTQDRFVTADFSTANVLLMTHISSSRDFLAAKRELGRICESVFGDDASCGVTGFGIVISATSQLVTQGQVKSLSITVVIIFGMMFVLFLSLRAGLAAIVPNCFPIVVNFGIMGWAGVELSLVTSLIASIAIGLAVDDTIHYLFRYNREFKRDLNEKRAMADTLRTVGRPIVFTTLTIGLGFSVLMFSSFQPTAIFGVMMAITMMAALVGDLVILPSLMTHVPLVTIWDLIRLRMGREPEKGLPIFHGLSRTQIHYVLLAGALKELPDGEVLFRKGEMSNSMYAIVSGELEILDTRTAADWGGDFSERTRVALLRTGDVVGEMGLVRSSRRSATAVAAGPVELLQINRRMIQRLQWLYPPAAYRFFFNLMRILCDRLEHTTHCLSNTGIRDDITGLPTRDTFMMELEKECERTRYYGTDMGVAVVELRAREGHGASREYHAGDRALERVAGALTDFLRRCDMLARIGNRRFGVLMVRMGPEETASACNRLWNMVNDVCDNGIRGWRGDVAIGFACAGPGRPGDPESLLREADEALGRAWSRDGPRVAARDAAA
ncbi:MAG: MMPL family transporter [Desulfatibacillaceae bacterium]